VGVNSAACELTGYTANELLQLWVWNLTPGEHSHQYERLWRAFLDRGEQSGEYLLLTRAGAAIPVRYVAQTNLLPGLHLSLLERKQGA
jgi:PAS domain S-box-containing protein